jgi:hypothetical protein
MADEITITANLRCIKSGVSITQQTTSFSDDTSTDGEMIQTNPDVPLTAEAMPLGPVSGVKYVRIQNGGISTILISIDGGTAYHLAVYPGACALFCFLATANLFWKSASTVSRAELSACERA